jgi:hypothetical protein
MDCFESPLLYAIRSTTSLSGSTGPNAALDEFTVMGLLPDRLDSRQSRTVRRQTSLHANTKTGWLRTACGQDRELLLHHYTYDGYGTG